MSTGKTLDQILRETESAYLSAPTEEDRDIIESCATFFETVKTTIEDMAQKTESWSFLPSRNGTNKIPCIVITLDCPSELILEVPRRRRGEESDELTSILHRRLLSLIVEYRRVQNIRLTYKIDGTSITFTVRWSAS